MNATTMPVGTLIFDLNEKGIKLSVKHGNLKVDAPQGKITSNVLEVLKERKPEIIKELEGIDEETQFGKMASLYRGAKLPNRIHLDEATRFFNKRGWIQIFSGYLNTNLYLVRNNQIKIPDPSLHKYTEKEVMKLHGLTLDELKTLHEAKVIFKGTIS
jgi:hypothetical protein